MQHLDYRYTLYLLANSGATSVRQSKKEKDRSRERILSEGSRLLRDQGLSCLKVSDVMGAAGMTQGGFYRHFESKDELASHLVKYATDCFLAQLQEGESAPEHEVDVQTFMKTYLSLGHVTNRADGCPIAALGTNQGGSGSQFDLALRQSTMRLISSLDSKDLTSPKSNVPSQQAYARAALLVGAVVMARLLPTDDAKRLLSACLASTDGSV